MERSRRVILAAALDLLAEVGCGAMTMEAIAARAGVGKSTVYRHWPGKLELVEDAIRTLKPVVTPPDFGSVRERVTALLVQVAIGLADSTWSSCLPAIIDAAERDPQVMAIHQRLARERRQMLVDLLAEGVEAGEVAGDVDLYMLSESLIGPIVMRRLLLHEPFDPAGVPALVNQVLRQGVRMRDLAPEITRQRLLIEGFNTVEVDESLVDEYLQGVAAHLGLRAYDRSAIFSPGGAGRDENQGFDAFLPLVDSGISLYVWTAAHFLAVVLFTCKVFDEGAAVAYTSSFFGLRDVEAQAF